MTERERVGRVPFEAIELDQDFCKERFGNALNGGSGNCTAEVIFDSNGNVVQSECFNTRATCKDVTNYNLGTRTLHFCSDAYTIPQDGNYWFPFLKKVSVSPGEINAGGANRNLSALGSRSTITVRMADRPHTDRIVDPYVETRKNRIPTYDPLDQSTFWSKWRARNPYYINRIIRYRSGYLKDGQIVDDVTRTFVITGFEGPDSEGNVVIKGKDVLSLAVDRKAQAPRASLGKLSADITSGDSSLTLKPSGIGDAEYPDTNSALIRINDEVIEFSRSQGSDQLTLKTRGAEDTEVSDHDQDDTVQLCIKYESKAPDVILEDLLKNYANIPAANLATADWAYERSEYLPRLYTGIITEPTGVSTLASELALEAQFYAWFDERNDVVQMRSVRPVKDEYIYNLNDDRHIIKDSVKVEDKTDQLLTRIIVNYGLRNPTLDRDKATNYNSTEVIFSPNAETAERHDGVRSKTVHCRWIPAKAAATALNLGEKLIERYQEVPRSVNFSLDAKDSGERFPDASDPSVPGVWVGAFARVRTRLNVDEFGYTKPMLAQVIKANESKQGTRFDYQAQEFSFTDADVSKEETVPLPDAGSATVDVTLRQVWDDQFSVTPDNFDKITFVVRSGTIIQASDTSTPALRTGTFPDNVDIFLIIEPDAFVVGHGGSGGAGGDAFADGVDASGTSYVLSANDGTNGFDGGPALDAKDFDGSNTGRKITIDNQGTIGGGGGGSGGSGGVSAVERLDFESNVGTIVAYVPVAVGGTGGAAGAGVGKGTTGSGGDATITDENHEEIQQTQGGFSGGTASVERGGRALTSLNTFYFGTLTFDSGVTTPTIIVNYNIVTESADGGDLGNSGLSSGDDAASTFGLHDTQIGAAGIGGNPGNAVQYGSNITYINEGTILGPRV